MPFACTRSGIQNIPASSQTEVTEHGLEAIMSGQGALLLECLKAPSEEPAWSIQSK
eukprot:CAMPEP_0170575578 /NCGR_PEP_ID=MMETSP0224-20130122/3936_1 /TAXON_ID=285029 /ORGANISM="Togula jolla, Strain CCCM 725" /LENGTH=55 /DNA_ID=CAMNT_0010898367 /DNA_START=544 /DNA_END=711 /DNA_ORIENTATION=+